MPKYKYTEDESMCELCGANRHRVKLVDIDNPEDEFLCVEHEDFMWCPCCMDLGWFGDQRTNIIYT